MDVLVFAIYLRPIPNIKVLLDGGWKYYINSNNSV